MPPATPSRLTVAEVARHLRLGTRKVYDFVARKGLPHVRAGGKLLFCGKRRTASIWPLSL